MTDLTTAARQVGGNHYQGLVVHPDKFATANGWCPCTFSVLKYMTRYENKNGLEDLKKAITFVYRRRAVLDDIYLKRSWQFTRPMISMRDYLVANSEIIPFENHVAFFDLERWAELPPRLAVSPNFLEESLLLSIQTMMNVYKINHSVELHQKVD